MATEEPKQENGGGTKMPEEDGPRQTPRLDDMHPRVVAGLKKLGLSLDEFLNASFDDRLKALQHLDKLDPSFWAHDRLSEGDDQISPHGAPTMFDAIHADDDEISSSNVEGSTSSRARRRVRRRTATSPKELRGGSVTPGKRQPSSENIDLSEIDEDLNLGPTKGSTIARYLCDILRESVGNETFIGVYWDSKGYSYRARIRGQWNASGGRFKPARWTLRGLKKSLTDAVRSRNMMARRFGLLEIDMPREIHDGGPSVRVGGRAMDGEERAKRLTRGAQRKDGQTLEDVIMRSLEDAKEEEQEMDDGMDDDSDYEATRARGSGRRNLAVPKPPSRMNTEDGGMSHASGTSTSRIKPGSAASAMKKATLLLTHLKTCLLGERRNGGRGPVLPALGIYWSKTLSRFTVQFTVQKRTYYGKGVVPEGYTWDKMRDALLIAVEQRNQLAESLNIPSRLDAAVLDTFQPPTPGHTPLLPSVGVLPPGEATEEARRVAPANDPRHTFAARLLRAARAVSPVHDKLTLTIEWNPEAFRYFGYIPGTRNKVSEFVPETKDEDGIKFACSAGLQTAGECDEVLTLIRTFKSVKRETPADAKRSASQPASASAAAGAGAAGTGEPEQKRARTEEGPAEKQEPGVEMEKVESEAAGEQEQQGGMPAAAGAGGGAGGEQGEEPDVGGNKAKESNAPGSEGTHGDPMPMEDK
ncbi:unnamed protein product [Vitrella brassicaformis CCMP3155]|uniref:Uncharacterized protein n=2 Tax=Vitrella brassicaformis TaxID=1169539 RepID=A0A0G4GKP5_VITBC|nr:unnamed protein product [Vitrella brassicaformis CCMP3155]|mmetsp:Transcript_41807/g.104342  ORF Transcript_41807/g.104342 Transcript_41807/m.104342 type:complete len:699 (+) Transcript_41807:84-2180(+)|eukprot:CEM30591.1 unnamed protein product [Vitrella brassicaformis CCMP3155]